MNETVLNSIKKIMEDTASKFGFDYVSVRYLPHGENGPEVEVLIDKDYNITMDDIQTFTDIVNPLIDEIEDDDEEGYLLDIASGGSEREVPYADLEKLVDRYLDIQLKTGEKITAKLIKFENDLACFQWFIKGRKKTKEIKEDEISKMKMGYKA